MSKQGFVYILTNKSNSVLYTGVTSDLKKRIYEHKSGLGGTFTSKYRVNKLVYYGLFGDISKAIEEEKRIKGGSRAQKIKLIESVNPDWHDLFEEL